MGVIKETHDRIRESSEREDNAQNVIVEFCDAREIDRDELRSFCMANAQKFAESVEHHGGFDLEDVAAIVCLSFHTGYESAAKQLIRNPLES